MIMSSCRDCKYNNKVVPAFSYLYCGCISQCVTSCIRDLCVNLPHYSFYCTTTAIDLNHM